MSECQICYEKFNLQNHKKIVCAFCDYKTCRTCIQTYLTTTVNDPHCPSCKKGWNREFVDANSTKTFCSKNLKNHRENVLLEREKSYLPEAQIAVIRRKQASVIRKQINEIHENIRTERLLIGTLEHNFNVLQRGRGDIDEAGPSDKKVFVKKCPVENCRGFLSTQWKCEICDNKICSKCNEIKEEEHDHVCDPNNVETVNLLKKDTKGCPTCGTLINRSSGCSQMWCPSCHTAFNWNTMKIEKGIIHNPHFYEFQKRQGGGNINRNVGDIPCGGLPTLYELNTFFNKPPQAPFRYRHYPEVRRPADLTFDEETIYDIHRLINHLENHEFRWEFRGVENPAANDATFHELRIKYLMNEIDEQGWKRQLQQTEKKTAKIRDIYNILRMFTLTSSDILRQLVVKDISLSKCVIDVTALRDYANEQLYIVRSRYNCVINVIRDSWNYSYRT